MKLTKDQVKHIAKLASLPINNEEIVQLEDQLSETLKFVENLNEISTENIEPTHSVTGLSNVLRPDETEPSLTQNQALQNAKSKKNGYFKVKVILEI